MYVLSDNAYTLDKLLPQYSCCFFSRFFFFFFFFYYDFSLKIKQSIKGKIHQKMSWLFSLHEVTINGYRKLSGFEYYNLDGPYKSKLSSLFTGNCDTT